MDAANEETRSTPDLQSGYELRVRAGYCKVDPLSADWKVVPRNERYGWLTATLRCQSNPKMYARQDRFEQVVGGPKSGYSIDLRCTLEPLERAQFYLERHRNTIQFADLTELSPSQVFVKQMYNTRQRVWDHVSVWRDSGKNIVGLNEPYDPSNQLSDFPGWCSQHGWRSVLLPKPIGTYYAGKAVCFLAAPPKSKADIDAMAARLIAGWAP
jgi:hypothetical protein